MQRERHSPSYRRGSCIPRFDFRVHEEEGSFPLLSFRSRVKTGELYISSSRLSVVHLDTVRQIEIEMYVATLKKKDMERQKETETSVGNIRVKKDKSRLLLHVIR